MIEEIFDEWLKSKGIQYTLEDLDELEKELKSLSLSDFIKNKALLHGYCPRCFEELKLIKVGEEMHEVFGNISSTDIKEAICPQCHKIYD